MEDVSEPSTTPVRPPHVTIACAIVIVGSVFVVAQMWDRIAGLGSVDTRTTLAAYLADSKLGQQGVGVAQLTTIVRVAAMAAAGCATAMLILGWQVTRRSRGARLALSVLAAALLLTGLVSDWFVESVAGTFWAGGIGAAVVTLWLGPARVWFSDNPASAAAEHESPVVQRPTSSATPPPPPHHDAPAPPATGEPPPPMHQPWPPTEWTPPPASAYDVPQRPQVIGQRPQVTGQRPPALLWACIVTWLCTGFAALLLVVSIVTLVQDAQPVLDEAYRQNPQLSEQGFSEHDLLVMLYVVIGVVLVGSMAAASFAVWLYRGRRWAWYALVIAAGVSTLFFLAGSFGSPIGLVPLAASVLTVVCLVRPEVRAWLLRR
jgi:hypothetical protein